MNEPNSYSTTHLKTKGIEFIVSALIELEDTGSLNLYDLICNPVRMSLIKKNNSSTVVHITKHTLSICWMSQKITLTRARTEEEYFQLMCLDDGYCDDEFEKGIKQLFDLYIKWQYSQFAIGGFIEGAYATDNENSE